MGRDKALLPLPDAAGLLWQRQLAVLTELQPEEIFWSGPERPGLPGGIRIVPDEVPDAGPLAGLGACLEKSQSDLLVVLAIDLPRMTSTFLRSLIERSTSSCGIVVREGDHFEPLAAVYPKGISELVNGQLARKSHALRDLVVLAIEQKMLRPVQMEEADRDLFTNWNSPGDIDPR